MRLRRGRNRPAPAATEGAPRRPRRSLTTAPRALARTALTALVEMLAIVREMLALPMRVWLSAAELVGEIVLALWRGAVLPLLELGLRILRAALGIGQREVSPARGLTVVALAATITLGASQFSDYRAVQVGAPQYKGVEDVAPAPQVEPRSPRSAHGVAVFAIAVAALFVTAFAVGGRWRLARLLIFLGAAVVLVSLAIDAPEGLREGDASVAYEGAQATLLGGFWAQLCSGLVLMVTGPLLAVQLRGERDARRTRRNGRLAGAGVAGSLPASTRRSGVEGAAT